MKTAPDGIRDEIEYARVDLGLDVDEFIGQTTPRRSVHRAIMRAAHLRRARHGPGPALETARECARRAAGIAEPPPRRRWSSAARAGMTAVAASVALAYVWVMRRRSL